MQVIAVNVIDQHLENFWAMFLQKEAVEQRHTFSGGLSGVERFFRDKLSVVRVIQAINFISSLCLLLEADSQQPMNQKISVPSDGRSKVGVKGKVEAIVRKLFRIFVLNTNVSCLHHVRNKLAVYHCHFVFAVWHLLQFRDRLTQRECVSQVYSLKPHCLEKVAELSLAVLLNVAVGPQKSLVFAKVK